MEVEITFTPALSQKTRDLLKENIGIDAGLVGDMVTIKAKGLMLLTGISLWCAAGEDVEFISHDEAGKIISIRPSRVNMRMV